MICTICSDEKAIKANSYNDCVLECLETIKLHYTGLRAQLLEKESKIQELQESNERLRNLQSCFESTSLKKPQKSLSPEKICNSNNNNNVEEKSSTELFGNGDVLADMSTDDINLALNSENEFECITSPVTTTSQEEITATEKSNSPRVFKKHIKSDKCSTQREKNNENKKPLDPVSNSGWISNETYVHKHNVNFLKPNNLTKDIPKKPSLSLRPSSSKLKQTRLHVDVVRSSFLSNNSTSEDVIKATPRIDTTPKRVNRQLLLKLQTNPIKQKTNDADETVFDFSPKKSLMTVDDEGENGGVLPMRTNEEKLNTYCQQERPSNSSSVILLTPPTETVFKLDDSSEDVTIETMDLLKNIMDEGETQICALKRLETKRIQHLQKENRNLHSKGAQEKLDPLRTKKGYSSNALNSKIKLENVSMETNNNEIDLESDLDDFIMASIGIKEEKSLVERTSVRESTKKSRRKFDVNCHDCQAYIKFLGDKLTDREIEQHIRNCTKHKNRDVHLRQTPDGFWDPFIQSFDVNDPRNETLVDTRFVQQTKRYK